MSYDYCRNQAEAFLGWERRSGGTFDHWADTKDFSNSARAGIRREVERLRAEGWRPMEPAELIRAARARQLEGHRWQGD